MQELQPQLAELLRTCVHPSSLLLRVARVEFVDTKYNQTDHISGVHEVLQGHRYATKLHLTDGELMIQAVLHRKLIGTRAAADLNSGDFLDIRQFAIKKALRSKGRGRVVFLAVEGCHFLTQGNDRHIAADKDTITNELNLHRKRSRSSDPINQHIVDNSPPDRGEEDDMAGGFLQSSPRKKLRFDLGDITSGQHGIDVAGESGTSCGKVPTTESFGSSCAGGEKILSPLFVKTTGKTKLSNIFGARNVLSDTDDSETEEYFQSVAEIKSTGRQHRKILQNLKSNDSMSPRIKSTCPFPNDNNNLSSSISHEHTISNILQTLPTAEDGQPTNTGKATQKYATWKVTPKPEGAFALSQVPVHLVQPRGNGAASAVLQKFQPAKYTAKSPLTQQQPQTSQQPLLPPPPFHTLSSLRNPSPSHPLPVKNYNLTTLAFVSWVGTTLIHRTGSPFPPKRHLKIIDPSLSASRPLQVPGQRQGQAEQPASNRPGSAGGFTPQNNFQDAVTVAVYLNASDFRPMVGTLALFRGLVMQRLGNGDVILNIYSRLGGIVFDDGQPTTTEARLENENARDDPLNSHWFITDQEKMRALGHGSRLDYYLEWWRERQVGNSNTAT